MAITRVAVGARSYVGTPGAPAGSASGDVWICCAGNIGGAALSMDAAWTAGPTALSPGNIRVAAWTFSYTGSTPTLTVTGASFCFIVAYRPTAGSTLAVDGSGSADTNAVGSRIDYPSASPSQANDMCVFGGFANCPDSTFSFAAISGTDPVPGIVFDENDAIDKEMSLSDGIRAASTATGARTQDFSSIGVNGGVLVLLKETVNGQTIVPVADVTDGNWLNEVGSNTNLFASIDEAVASDADWIQSGDAPNADACELQLGSAGNPDTGTVTVTVRARLTQSGNRFMLWAEPFAELQVDLVETSTIRATRYLRFAVGEQTQTFDLTAGERSAISAWSDLRYRFTATTTAGRVRVTWATLTAPLDVGSVSVSPGYYRRYRLWEMAA